MSVLVDSGSYNNDAERALYEERKLVNQARYLGNKAVNIGLDDALFHVHTNPDLGPKTLLEAAADSAVAKNVYISKDSAGPLTADNLNTAKIHFHFLAPRPTWSLFAPDYRGRARAIDHIDTYQQMLYQDFLQEFGSNIDRDNVIRAITKSLAKQDAEALRERLERSLPEDSQALAMTWLQHKAVMNVDSTRSQWTSADAQNEMTKGLLSYELAYRRYVQLLLAESVKGSTQYTDIRLNLVNNKVFKTDNPADHYDNFGIMDMIIDEYERFRTGEPGTAPLRVIYCTPPILNVAFVEKSLAECLAMKQDPKYAEYIAGFEIVGKADTLDQRLSFFEATLENFEQDCATASVSIPLLLSTVGSN